MKKTLHILRRTFFVILALFFQQAFTLNSVKAQTFNIELKKQVHFDKMLPKGNYSGITNIDNDLYALVNDKSALDGFHIFHIEIDSISGEILSINDLGFRGFAPENRDAEGIAYLPSSNTICIVGEADNQIREYTLMGKHTERMISLPTADPNYGYESLTFDANRNLLWTCTERMLPNDQPKDTLQLIRFQTYNVDFQPYKQYEYVLDAPTMTGQYRNYAHGISELLALTDGTLLVLEREIAVPTSKIGAKTQCKLYAVTADQMIEANDSTGSSLPLKRLSKIFLCKWTSRLTLLDHSLANYEGMCLGPKLTDGSQTIVLVADSQNRAGGVLKDWFRVLILRNKK